MHVEIFATRPTTHNLRVILERVIGLKKGRERSFESKTILSLNWGWPPLNMGDYNKNPLKPSEKISQNVFPTQICEKKIFSKSRKENLSRFYSGIHTS